MPSLCVCFVCSHVHIQVCTYDSDRALRCQKHWISLEPEFWSYRPLWAAQYRRWESNPFPCKNTAHSLPLESSFPSYLLFWKPIYLYLCMFVYLYVHHGRAVIEESRKEIISHGIGVTNIWELPDNGHWQPNLGLLQDQQVLLSNGLPLQPTDPLVLKQTFTETQLYQALCQVQGTQRYKIWSLLPR